jgi:hypothetical protein
MSHEETVQRGDRVLCPFQIHARGRASALDALGAT